MLTRGDAGKSRQIDRQAAKMPAMTPQPRSTKKNPSRFPAAEVHKLPIPAKSATPAALSFVILSNSNLNVRCYLYEINGLALALRNHKARACQNWKGQLQGRASLRRRSPPVGEVCLFSLRDVELYFSS